MTKKILVTLTLGLALLFAVVFFAGPLQVQSQPAPSSLLAETPYPGPRVVEPESENLYQAYPEPEGSNGAISMTALVLVAVVVVVFVVAVLLVSRLRRTDQGWSGAALTRVGRLQLIPFNY